MKPVARDLVADAQKRAKKRPDRSRRLLDEAETVAETGSDWAAIAEGWLAIGDTRAARRSIATALANPYDADTFFHVALLLHRDLSDADAARAALEGCERYLETTQRSSWQWTRIARHYVQILGDRAKARSIYERRASDAHPLELVDIAKGYIEELSDRDAALAVLDRAEATWGSYDAATLADAYRDLAGDAARARRIIDDALASTSDIRIALSIVRFAPRSKRDDALALERAAFAKAEAIAATTADWIDIAEHHHDRETRDRDDVRRCLERAVGVATTDDERRAIADSYRYRLNDAAAADALGPTGIAPRQIARVQHTLDGWTSDPARLLDWLRPQLDAKQLDRLAGAAGHAPEKHLAVIAGIARTGLVPYPLDWYPREALEMERWKTGAGADPLRCAFACTILLIDTTGPIYRDSFEPTIAVLVNSCRELGPEALDGAIGLLVALAESFEPQLPCLAFALLGLLLVTAARDPLDARLPSLCDRLLTIVADHEQSFSVYSDKWLLGLTNMDMRHQVFRRLAASILGADSAPPHLRAIATRFA